MQQMRKLQCLALSVALYGPRVRQEDGGKKQEKGIVVQSWYPFGGRGWTAPILEYPEIVRIGRAH